MVNAQFTDVSRALDELDDAISQSQTLTDEQRLDAAGDLSTIRTQIAKKNPDRTIIGTAWSSLKAIATAGGVVGAVEKVSQVIGGFLAGGG